MKFDKNELKEELKELKKKNWLSKDFNEKDFFKKIITLEFTSPNKGDVFNAFKIGEDDSIINPEDVRILILGQDPYPDKDDKRVDVYGKRAHGLAFSFANSNGEIEPADDSLLNIFKAIKHYNKYETKSIDKWNTNLKTWASKNKILLLNTALTYKQEEGHFKTWEPFITEIICNLVKNKSNNSNMAIFLWGKHAQNVFFQSLNKLNENGLYDKEIENLKKNIKQVELNKRSKNKKINKLNETIRNNNEIKIFGEIAIYLTNHPSQISENNNGRFIEFSKSHFEACDKYLGKDIWKNFPENNQ